MSTMRWILASGLLTDGQQRNPGVRSHGIEQRGDGLCDRAAVASEMQLAQQNERIHDLSGRRRELLAVQRVALH